MASNYDEDEMTHWLAEMCWLHIQNFGHTSREQETFDWYFIHFTFSKMTFYITGLVLCYRHLLLLKGFSCGRQTPFKCISLTHELNCCVSLQVVTTGSQRPASSELFWVKYTQESSETSRGVSVINFHPVNILTEALLTENWYYWFH